MAEVDWQMAGAKAAATDISRWAEAAVKVGRADIKALMVEALEKALAKLAGAGGQS